MFISLINSLM